MAVRNTLHTIGDVLSSRILVTLPLPVGNPDLKNQIMIVTGASGGLGFEACVHLARLEVGTIIMAVRNMTKGLDAKNKIVAAFPKLTSSIEVWQIDMCNHESIKQFVQRASQLPRLDGVLANAGIMTTHFEMIGGNEKTLAVNVINTFLLYLLLLPTMRQSGQSTGNSCRFSIPNSALHFLAPLSELDPAQPSILTRLNDKGTAQMDGRYPLSKLLVLYVIREFAARSKASGSGAICIINSPNPSFCKSNLAMESQDSRAYRLVEKVLARSTEEGSRSLVHGVLAGDNSQGQYLSNCHVASAAPHVSNEWGQEVQKKFFNELLAKLEQIHPGISSNL